ncbi:MAG: hypothetical protein ABI878_15565 [Acidobacteriota bacterium]
MSNEAPQSVPGYDERIAQYEAVVAKLSEDHQKNPTPELQLQLNRKSDALLHLKNLAKGGPKERAKKAAEAARITTLTKAVTQPLNMS